MIVENTHTGLGVTVKLSSIAWKYCNS